MSLAMTNVAPSEVSIPPAVLPTTSVEGHGLRIHWPDGHSGWFHVRWLRENCPCARCMHPDAWERRVDLGVLPLDMWPARVTATADGLHLDWPTHGAECGGTHYSWEWLDANRTETDARRARSPRRHRWRGAELDADDHVVHYDELMASDDALAAFMGQVVEGGFALVHGMPTTHLEVLRFAEGLAFVEESHFDRYFEVRSKPNPVNLSYTAETLPPHNDLASRRHLPGVQFLHCLVNDARGGESVLVDALTVAEVLRDTDPEAYELLVTTPVRFTSVADTWWIVNRRPIIETDADGEVVGTRLHPALLGPVDVEPDVIHDWYRAHDALLRIAVDPDLQFTFRLEAGHCQVFDNQRVLHSRRRFDPASGRRVLQGCYTTLDDFTSRLMTLRRAGTDFRHR